MATAREVIESGPKHRAPENLNRMAAVIVTDVLALVGIPPTDSKDGRWASVYRVFLRDAVGAHVDNVRPYAREVQKPLAN
jgi:hypothetical protein